MIPNHLKIFLIAFLAAALWYRVFLKLVPKSYVISPALRRLLKLQWHHYHYGIILVLIGTVALTLIGIKTWVLVMLGVGLGFIMDEFIWSLMMPGDSSLELATYTTSLRPTLALLAIIVILSLVISYLSG